MNTQTVLTIPSQCRFMSRRPASYVCKRGAVNLRCLQGRDKIDIDRPIYCHFRTPMRVTLTRYLKYVEHNQYQGKRTCLPQRLAHEGIACSGFDLWCWWCCFGSVLATSQPCVFQPNKHLTVGCTCFLVLITCESMLAVFNYEFCCQEENETEEARQVQEEEDLSCTCPLKTQGRGADGLCFNGFL